MNQARRKKVSHALEFLGFTMPAVIAILLFVGIPFFMCIFYSLRKWNGIQRKSTFIGLQNYIRAFTNDSTFIKAIGYTLLYALLTVILINIIALLLSAILEQSNLWGKGFFRAAFYIPNIISLIIIGFIWKFIFGRAFEAIHQATGIRAFGWSWLGQPKLAVISTVLVTVWQALGFYILIYIAGLQSVPDDVLEAATIDGAGKVRRFFSVVLPLIVPSITVCTFYSIANSLKMFELIFTLTGGGPGDATTSVALDIYNTAFNSNQYGYGSAKSVILFVMVAFITILQVTLFKKKEIEA
ncbi:ABC transporter inner membrane protein [[Clostridium] cellulosi]|uniref:ABC transporter inner membrane protein n=1 Tax=[Clostridium] cellulosi TaxID=29343 RepID=A0A078KRI5_9FIRM|nr:ABC transporter inner membrane protein [[Clostridium] cellulosi]